MSAASGERPARSEVRRGAVRIISNYARLFVQLALGFALIPILLAGLGPEAFGAWGVLMTLVGVGDQINEIVRPSMVRELASAYHDPDRARFRAVYNSAILLSLRLVAVTCGIYIALILSLPLWKIDASLRDAAQWFLVARCVNSCAFVVLSPHYDMLLVSERMGWYNFWGAIDRSSNIIAAVLIFLVLGERDPASGLVQYAAVSFGGSILVILLGAWMMRLVEPRMRIELSSATRAGMASILRLGGWNTIVTLGLSMHIRLSNLILNRVFGAREGNAVFAPAVTLSSYVRQATVGMTGGLEAVAARLASAHPRESMRDMARHMTRLHAWIALPAMAGIIALGEPLMRLWIGRSLKPEDRGLIDAAIPIAQVLAIGWAGRAISDGWVNLLYGAGHIRRYAPIVLAGGLASPAIVIGLIVTLPDARARLAPAIAFALLMVLGHVLALSRVAARHLHVRARDLFLPMLCPAIAVLLCAPILLGANLLLDHWSIPRLLATIAAFGAAYALASAFIVFDRAERRRLASAIASRLGR